MTTPSPTAEAILAFANTVDLEEGTDELSSPSAFGRWLFGAGCLDRPPRVRAADLADGLALRSGIRAALAADGTPEPALLEPANRVLADLPLLVSLGGGTDGVVHAPAGERPVRRALTAIAIDWARLVLTGEAGRLRRCADDTCGWVFWDTSKNGSRRWCSMRVCGNRSKARRYASRQREPG